MYSNKYLDAFLNKISTLVYQNEFQKANFQNFSGEACSQTLVILHALDDDKCIKTHGSVLRPRKPVTTP